PTLGGTGAGKLNHENRTARFVSVVGTFISPALNSPVRARPQPIGKCTHRIRIGEDCFASHAPLPGKRHARHFDRTSPLRISAGPWLLLSGPLAGVLGGVAAGG